MAAAPSTDYETITLAPLSPTIGVEIGGVRMSGKVSAQQVAEIRRALVDWKVVFFRDQDVTLEEHVSFGRLFGELEIHPFTPNHAEHPEIVVIHNDERTKKGQNDWHSDVTRASGSPSGFASSSRRRVAGRLPRHRRAAPLRPMSGCAR